MSKTVRDAAMELPEDCRATFLKIWSLAAIADNGDGVLWRYFDALHTQHVAYRMMLEERVEMLNKIQAILKGQM